MCQNGTLRLVGLIKLLTNRSAAGFKIRGAVERVWSGAEWSGDHSYLNFYVEKKKIFFFRKSDKIQNLSLIHI